MEKDERCEWIGVDGQRYEYSVHDFYAKFKDGEYGNYIFTKKTNDGHWVPIYIGQGDLGIQIGKTKQLKCVKEMGATHVHVHKNNNEWVRTSEELDLLENYIKTFEPFGCNYNEGDKEDEKETRFE